MVVIIVNVPLWVVLPAAVHFTMDSGVVVGFEGIVFVHFRIIEVYMVKSREGRVIVVQIGALRGVDEKLLSSLEGEDVWSLVGGESTSLHTVKVVGSGLLQFHVDFSLLATVVFVLLNTGNHVLMSFLAVALPREVSPLWLG